MNRTRIWSPGLLDPCTTLGYTGGGDSPDLVIDATGAVVERTIALAGGALLTKRGAEQVWSLPNQHGDTAVVNDAAGVVVGPARTYDRFGDTTGRPLVDHSAGLMDYAWLGRHQWPTEHETGLAPTIEMGARQYDPTLGRFLEVDPVEGGSANDYGCTNGDPVNGTDLDGNCGRWGNPWNPCGVRRRRGRWHTKTRRRKSYGLGYNFSTNEGYRWRRETQKYGKHLRMRTRVHQSRSYTGIQYCVVLCAEKSLSNLQYVGNTNMRY